MGNIATILSDQIHRLKSRGMDLDLDENKIKEILLDIGYYRLGFYWHPFEKNRNHEFLNGTKFSDAVALYYLDMDLRNILLKYINRIEINFRTKVVYYTSNKYRHSPTWFIDPKVISNDFTNDINKYYSSNFIKNNKPIHIHHKNYINDRYAPAWKSLEFFTFGVIAKIYKSLLDKDLQERIADEYNIINLKKFINFIDTIVYVRNMCAHGGVIFDLQTPKGIAAIPQISFNNNNRHSLDSSIKVISYILGSISENRKYDLQNDVAHVFNSYIKNESIRNIVETKTGYCY